MTQHDQSLRSQPTPSQPANRQSRSRRATRRSLLWISSAFVIALAVVLSGGWLLLQRAYDGRIVPNVVVQGVSVGGLRPEEAKAALQQRFADLLGTPLTVSALEHTWTPTAAEIGLDLPIGAAVAQAFAIGRGPDNLLDLDAARRVWANGQQMTLTATVDRPKLKRYLETLAAPLTLPPQDATLLVRDGAVISTPASDGRTPQLEGLVEQITAGLLQLQPQQAEIHLTSIRPALADEGIATAKAQLTTLLAQSMTITVADQSRTWSPTAIGAMVRIVRQTETNGDRLSLDLQPTVIEQWLTELAPMMATQPTEPRLRFAEGRVQIVELGRDGEQLDVRNAMAQITAALWQGNGQVTIALSPVPPAIRPETLASLGIQELVAEGRSDFSGSAPYRVQNIRAGAARMDGVLIAPGAQFSFNEHVGAIDERNGFTEGYAIINGRTQLEWGGGVCQVSTTVFRAAFWAGVPISERNQHSFRIRWYEVYEPIGMDAAIFTGPGGYDFRFVNDTGAWLLMQTEVDVRRTRLTVRLYGTKPAREVIQTPAEITNERPAPPEPRYVRDDDLPSGTIKQTDTKRGGMDVRIGRIVRQHGKVLYRDTFVSRYQPWPDIFALGPGAEAPTPTALPTTTLPAEPPTAPPTSESLPEPTPTSAPPEEPPPPSPVPPAMPTPLP
jgi:vancomycin resistance protein YoaR